jgi:hypothetical protein
MYGRLIYTLICMSDCLLTQENPNSHLTPPPDVRSCLYVLAHYFYLHFNENTDLEGDHMDSLAQTTMVGRCRLTVSEPMLKAPMVSALEATM